MKPKARRRAKAKATAKVGLHYCRKCGSTAARSPKLAQDSRADPIYGRLWDLPHLAWPCPRCGAVLRTPTLDSNDPGPAKRMLKEMDRLNRQAATT